MLPGMSVTFTTITVPTAEPYDSKHPNRQRENFFYVLNQALAQLQNDGATVEIDLSALTNAVLDLSLSGVQMEFPGFKISRVGRTLTFQLTP